MDCTRRPAGSRPSDFREVGEDFRHLDRRLRMTGEGAPDLYDPAATGSLAEAIVAHLPPGSPEPPYLRRLLLADGDAGRQLFRRMYEISTMLVDALVKAGLAPRGGSTRCPGRAWPAGHAKCRRSPPPGCRRARGRAAMSACSGPASAAVPGARRPWSPGPVSRIAGAGSAGRGGGGESGRRSVRPCGPVGPSRPWPDLGRRLRHGRAGHLPSHDPQAPRLTRSRGTGGRPRASSHRHSRPSGG